MSNTNNLRGARVYFTFLKFYFIKYEVYRDMKSKKKSRRINSYEKPKTVKLSVKFPYNRYRIDWIDIITEGGWGSEKEFKAMKLATPVSEGWLFSKDAETVRIFAGYDVEEDGSIHFSERSVFPTSCVKKMTRIH